jgi:hypothetical protein
MVFATTVAGAQVARLNSGLCFARLHIAFVPRLDFSFFLDRSATF